MISPPGPEDEDTLARTLRAWGGQVRAALFGANSVEDDSILTENGRVRTDAVDICDEAVVQQLLDLKSGRIKQSSIIARTDWSASKVSRLLSSMEDDGSINRVRIGREKVVVDDDRTDGNV